MVNTTSIKLVTSLTNSYCNHKNSYFDQSIRIHFHSINEIIAINFNDFIDWMKFNDKNPGVYVLISNDDVLILVSWLQRDQP